jgi:hypothetical protein
MVRVGSIVTIRARSRPTTQGTNMHDNKDDYDLGREIERSWLIRGEHDKVYDAKGTAYMIFGGIVLVSIILGLLLNALGIW